MTSQRHVIEQQIIDLQISSDLKAFELQSELSSLYYSQIIPLIESYCNDLSEPDTIYRIDHLEINLGIIDSDNWQLDLIDKIASALREKLSQELVISSPQTSLSVPQTIEIDNNASLQETESVNPKQIKSADVSLELFCYFIETGYLPWWSESLSKQMLENYCEQLLQTSPKFLKAQLTTQLKQLKSLNRLIYQFSDHILVKVLSLWIPNFYQVGGYYITAIKKLISTITNGKKITLKQLRLSLWQELFSTTLLHSNSTSPLPLESAILSNLDHIAIILDIETQYLLQQLSIIIESEDNYFSQTINRILTQQKTKLNPWLNNSQSQEIGTQINPIDKLNSKKFTYQEFTSSESNPLATLIHLLKELTNLDIQQVILSSLPSQINTLLSQLSPILFNSSSAMISLNPLLKKIEIIIKEAENNNVLADESNVKSLKAIAQTLKTSLNQSYPDQNKEILSKKSFSISEKIYIQNAGLVLLWPFLDRFFTNLNLVQGSQFINIQKSRKAVLLLQYLVDSSLTIPEHLLPLNKILCGLDILEPIETNLELSQQEESECNDLLLAIIQNWSVLKNTTPQGLRQAFLQRAGILTPYNDNWRLQVEQVTYDLLLDQLPWNIVVVQLPWMDGLISVEW